MTTRIPATPSRASGRLPWIALIAAAPAAWAGTPINERAAADPAGQVEISNIAGSVVVTGWDRAEVEVTGELGKGAERLEFSRAGKLTRVKVDHAEAKLAGGELRPRGQGAGGRQHLREHREAPTSACRACGDRSDCSR